MPVCPTGASLQAQEDGIVLVDYDKCIGCKYCSWACPYGAREFDEERKVMTKRTLCVTASTTSCCPEDPQAGLRARPADWRPPVRRRHDPTPRYRRRSASVAATS